MKIYQDCSLYNFSFWGSATYITDKLTVEEFESLEPIIEELYPDGIDETNLNDLFAFDGDSVLSWIGLSEEEVENRE